MKARITSSRYGLYKFGLQMCYNEDVSNRAFDKRRRSNRPPSTDRFLQFETREDGIASNRKSAKLR